MGQAGPRVVEKIDYGVPGAPARWSHGLRSSCVEPVFDITSIVQAFVSMGKPEHRSDRQQSWG